MISTQRSYADLVYVARTELPKYFNFEGAALLFRDTVSNDLFSIETEYNPDEI